MREIFFVPGVFNMVRHTAVARAAMNGVKWSRSSPFPFFYVGIVKAENSSNRVCRRCGRTGSSHTKAVVPSWSARVPHNRSFYAMGGKIIPCWWPLDPIAVQTKVEEQDFSRTSASHEIEHGANKRKGRISRLGGHRQNSGESCFSIAMNFLAIILFVCTSTCCFALDLPDHLFERATDFAKDDASTLMQLQKRDVDTLYKVARRMNEQGDRLTSTQIWHALADDEQHPHLLSQVALGFAYAENDKALAIRYFVDAGEAGPHQAALYNAGRLLVELNDWTRALAYLRAAAILGETHPENAKLALTETAEQAYRTLSQQIMKLSAISLQQAADMFLYSNLEDYPKRKSKPEKLWGKAMQALQKNDHKSALNHIQKLQGDTKLSDLQLHLLKAIEGHVRRGMNEEL